VFICLSVPVVLVLMFIRVIKIMKIIMIVNRMIILNAQYLNQEQSYHTNFYGKMTAVTSRIFLIKTGATKAALRHRQILREVRR
jgi:hypothetical protein